MMRRVSEANTVVHNSSHKVAEYNDILTNKHKKIIVLYGWKVNVQEQNKIVGELHIPRENFTFPRS